jgi:hypothetical protein
MRPQLPLAQQERKQHPEDRALEKEKGEPLRLAPG